MHVILCCGLSPCLSGLLSLSAGGRELVLWYFALEFSVPCRMLLSHTCPNLPGSLMKNRARRRAAGEAGSRSPGRRLLPLSPWARTRGQDERLWRQPSCSRPQLRVGPVLEAEAAPEWRSATVAKAGCELEKVLFHLQFMVTHIVFLRNKCWWHFMGRTLGRCVPSITVTYRGIYGPTNLAPMCNSDCLH